MRQAQSPQSDPGRHAGVQHLLASRFNLLGPYNDDKTGASAARTSKVSVEKGNFGEFKVPSLRNLILTAPYGHDGSIDSVAEVVRHYSDHDPVRMPPKGRTARQTSEPEPAQSRPTCRRLESCAPSPIPGASPEDDGHSAANAAAARYALTSERCD